MKIVASPSTSTRSSSPPSPCSLATQAIWFAIGAKVFAISEGLMPDDQRPEQFLLRVATLERGLLAGSLSFLGGIGLVLWIAIRWAAHGWGPLDYPSTMRVVIPGFALAALGFQTVLSSFFVSILGMRRK